MFRKFISNLLESSNTRNSQLLLLAKVEYGRDWQWAYNELINGRSPVKGVTQ